MSKIPFREFWSKSNIMETTHEHKFSENYHQIPTSYIREILNVANADNMISFAGGLPNPKFFPEQELAESAKQVLSKKGKEVLQYAGSQGYLPLRNWIASRYNKKYNLAVSPEDIVITNGSQQTIDVVSKLFLNQGEGVIVEKPTYLGGIQAMAGYSPQFLNVDLHNDGPDLEQIERHCLNHVPKFMYCIPNFQNPSGICYSLDKREKLAKLAQQYNLLILEDDPYNEIRFEGKDLPPLYKLAPEHVIWSGSFSKMVAPGLRMGWVVLPKGMAPHFIKTKQSTDLHSNNLSQFMLHHFLTHHSIDNHLQTIRHAYKKQYEFMLQMIKKYFPTTVKTTVPQGGMFLWLTIPEAISAQELCTSCLSKGVAAVPGKSFFTNGSGDQHIRMNFSNSSLENIEKGIRIMANEINILNGNTVSFVH